MNQFIPAGCLALLFTCPTIGFASIAYTDFEDMTTHSSKYFDMDDDGTFDVGVVWDFNASMNDTSASASLPLGANPANGFAASGVLASKLSEGDTIDQNLAYKTDTTMLSRYWDDWDWDYYTWGKWDNMEETERGYLGFQFKDSSEDLHFGWIQARVNPENQYITLYDMAWETTADTAITAGDVGSPVPIPGAMWLLGSALMGFAAIKRKK